MASLQEAMLVRRCELVRQLVLLREGALVSVFSLPGQEECLIMAEIEDIDRRLAALGSFASFSELYPV